MIRVIPAACPLPLLPAYGVGDNSDASFMIVLFVVGLLVMGGMVVYRLLRKRDTKEFVCEQCGSLNISVAGATATCVDCGHVADIDIDPTQGGVR